jgi:uncharacterized protein YqeY
MSLEVQVMDAMKTAMKEKDKVALDALRAIKAQIILVKTTEKEQMLHQSRKLQFYREW